MIKPFANSARALSSGPLTWRTWTGLIVIPVLVMGLLTWAFWAPDSDHGTATAAVVNNDEPAKVDGQVVPLGRELAGDLTHNEESAYKWVLTDDEDAAEGLKNGKYAAVVTIPKNFSKLATSTASDDPLDARRAVVDVKTSTSAGVADPKLSQMVARTTQQTLNRQVVETYLDNIYVGFSTLHKQIGKAADGAGKLAEGTGELVPGTRKLADGSSRLASAADQLADGAGRLADGTGKLADGSSKLAGGLTKAEKDTAQLPELTRQLADGAKQVADGNEQLAKNLVPLANRIIKAIDALPSAGDAAEKLQELAERCPGSDDVPGFCGQLRDAADRLAGDAEKIDGAKNSVRAAAVQTRDAVSALAKGSRKVADGNKQLADNMGTLVRGISDAAKGARQLDQGIQQTDKGAKELADGAGQLGGGAGELAGGVRELADGTVQLDEGAKELSDGLTKGADEIPTYNSDERDHLKTVAANPTLTSMQGAAIGPLALTLFAALALWSLALATYIVTRAVPDAVLTARQATWKIIVRAAIPGATAAALAAVAITALAVPVLDLSAGETAAFLGVALLAASAFVALNQALAAIFGRPGRLASIAVLVLTGATGVVSTLPGPLYSVTDYLPTHGAIQAMRAIVADGSGLAGGIAELVGWLLVGTLAAIVVTDRRRYLSGKRLRRPALPAHA